MQVGGTEIEALVETLLELTRRGGEIALKFHGKLDQVHTKADRTPLTEADLAVDAYLCDELAQHFPNIDVVTEERSASHRGMKPGSRFFLVDPIDGTREFVAERGEFTINIALIEGGIPVAGAVCAPAVGRAFAGGVDCPAFETDSAGYERRAIRPRKADNAALRVVASRSHLDPDTIAFIGANLVSRTINGGSSLKFCLLAAGEADLYPRFGPTMEWDTAAGHAILAAAGGFVEEISGTALKYGKASYRNGPFIAYTPGTKFVVPAKLRTEQNS
jgi:3'(2'), 5'-bisphosphate nucleotidase